MARQCLATLFSKHGLVKCTAFFGLSSLHTCVLFGTEESIFQKSTNVIVAWFCLQANPLGVIKPGENFTYSEEVNCRDLKCDADVMYIIIYTD